jgi:hypothetical protein
MALPYVIGGSVNTLRKKSCSEFLTDSSPEGILKPDAIVFKPVCTPPTIKFEQA